MTTSSVSNPANTTATTNAGSAAATVASMDPLANEQVLLQLLVAQLKYQDRRAPPTGPNSSPNSPSSPTWSK